MHITSPPAATVNPLAMQNSSQSSVATITLTNAFNNNDAPVTDNPTVLTGKQLADTLTKDTAAFLQSISKGREGDQMEWLSGNSDSHEAIHREKRDKKAVGSVQDVCKQETAVANRPWYTWCWHLVSIAMHFASVDAANVACNAAKGQ